MANKMNYADWEQWYAEVEAKRADADDDKPMTFRQFKSWKEERDRESSEASFRFIVFIFKAWVLISLLVGLFTVPFVAAPLLLLWGLVLLCKWMTRTWHEFRY